jgi:hypothetical protein
VADAPAGAKLLRGTCRQFRALALLHAHTQTDIVIDRRTCWELSRLQEARSLSADPKFSSIAGGILISRRLPHLQALSLEVKAAPQLESVLTAVASLTHLTKLVLKVVGLTMEGPNEAAEGLDYGVWNADMHTAFGLTVVPALTQLQHLKVQTIAEQFWQSYDSDDELEDQLEGRELFWHLGSLTCLTRLDWGVLELKYRDIVYQNMEALPLVEALPQLPALRSLTLRSWDARSQPSEYGPHTDVRMAFTPAEDVGDCIRRTWRTLTTTLSQHCVR